MIDGIWNSISSGIELTSERKAFVMLDLELQQQIEYCWESTLFDGSWGENFSFFKELFDGDKPGNRSRMRSPDL